MLQLDMFGRLGKEVTQIKMFMDYLYTFSNSTEGMDTALVETLSGVPVFIPMMLAFVFFVVLIAGYSAQSKRTGNGDLPLWSSIASLSTLMIAMALSLVQGLMSGGTLAIVVTITIASGVWLFLDKNSREV